MKVTYTPEDGDRQSWEFHYRRVRAAEAIMIERRYGKPFDEFQRNIMVGEASARQILLWHLLRRDHPTRRFEDTPDFAFGELEVQFDVHELREMRQQLTKVRGSLTEAEREAMLAAIDGQIEELTAVEGEYTVDGVVIGDGEPGKALSQTGSDSTG